MTKPKPGAIYNRIPNQQRDDGSYPFGFLHTHGDLCISGANALTALLDRAEAAESALATVRRDAERYRWLRENWWNYGCGTEGGYPMQARIGGKEWWATRDALCEVKSHAELDAAIDAALAEQPKEPKE